VAVVVLLLLILITAVVIVITCNMRQKKKARGTTKSFMALFPWELEGITSSCCLLVGQYPHHMTHCPPVSMVKNAMEPSIQCILLPRPVSM